MTLEVVANVCNACIHLNRMWNRTAVVKGHLDLNLE